MVDSMSSQMYSLSWSETDDNLTKKYSDGQSSTQKYACDGRDCFAIKQIKKYLTIEIIVAILKHKDKLQAMGFSLGFIEFLLSVGIGKSLPQNNNAHEEVTLKHFVKAAQFDQNLPSETDGSEYQKDAAAVVDMPIQSELTKEGETQLATQCKKIKKGYLSLLECKLCGYQSKSSKLMIRHLGCHDNGKCFTCLNCGYNTPFRSKWNKHRCRISAEGRDLMCRNCQDSFQTKVALDHHIATHHADLAKTSTAKLFVCDKCPYVGKYATSLADHQRKHTGDYLKCSEPGCCYQTPYRRSLQRHLDQKHSKDKPKICPVCGIQTKHALSLSEHMRRHDKIKKYKCSLCSFASHCSTDVVLHLKRKHHQEKKYECTKCAFHTGYPMVLKRHLARHENGDVRPKTKVIRKKKEHHCSFCKKIFNTKTEMMKHSDICGKMPLPHITSPALAPANDMVGSDPKGCDVHEPNRQEMYHFDSQLDMDISEEVFNITNNMLNYNDSGEDRTNFTTIMDDSLGNIDLTQDSYHGQVANDPLTVTAYKGRNPMLAETTRRDDSPLLGESLLSLMSDFPRPPPTNRCQSATTLMFTSLSPHLVDRPLTPDFLSDNPSSSFFL